MFVVRDTLVTIVFHFDVSKSLNSSIERLLFTDFWSLRIKGKTDSNNNDTEGRTLPLGRIRDPMEPVQRTSGSWSQMETFNTHYCYEESTGTLLVGRWHGCLSFVSYSCRVVYLVTPHDPDSFLRRLRLNCLVETKPVPTP